MKQDLICFLKAMYCNRNIESIIKSKSKESNLSDLTFILIEYAVYSKYFSYYQMIIDTVYPKVITYNKCFTLKILHM